MQCKEVNFYGADIQFVFKHEVWLNRINNIFIIA